MFAETDVDEGHDWDIFNINEGLETHHLGFAFILYCIKCQFHWPIKRFPCRDWTGPAGGRYPSRGGEDFTAWVEIVPCVVDFFFFLSMV